jgi:hypothetical protein
MGNREDRDKGNRSEVRGKGLKTKGKKQTDKDKDRVIGWEVGKLRS